MYSGFKLNKRKPINGAIRIADGCLSGRSGYMPAGNRHCLGYRGRILQCQQCSLAWMPPQHDSANLRLFSEQKYRQAKTKANNQSRIPDDIIRSRSQMCLHINIEARILGIGSGHGANACNILSAGYSNMAMNEWGTSSLAPAGG